jgi:RHS repeat-associated protein
MFTGKDRDWETGLDYFGARYFSGPQGRFTSPDWSAKPQAIPYASLTDPQTINLYGYLRNNPLNKADPDGHCSLSDCWKNMVSAYNYVKSVAYLKVEGGFGLEVGVKAGPVKLEVGAKQVSETKIAAPENTKTEVTEAKAQVEVGPLKVGPAITGEKELAKGNEISPPGGKTEWKGNLLYDVGKGSGSGWDVGLGLKVGVGIEGGIEVGVNGQKIANDIHDAFSVPPPPSAPAPPSPPQ